MAKTIRLAAGYALACLLAACPAPGRAANGFALRVDDISGLAGPWPLVAGLPFPEGELADAAGIRVTVDGREVPAQVDATATWRDGSIRWARASFIGAPGNGYRVEYGPGVTRRAPEVPVTLRRGADGGFTVDTGAAVYEFRPDRLLPERARMGGIEFLSGSGAGAYLVDNRGRHARVAGPGAEVSAEVLAEGPIRLVLRREGWYVTGRGERLARALAWFYFFAGSPCLRVTHSLVFTEDTNDVWVRDYGLEFRTPGAPGRVTFALGPPGEEAMFEASQNGEEVSMFQDTYPHFLERESRAVIARGSAPGGFELKGAAAAGDWADAVFDGYGLTVVMPWLAQQFPKEIAFGAGGARLAFWSGRGGRELDFRASTLVREYWRGWADRLVTNADSNVVPWVNKYWELERKPEGAEALARWPSNARGAARTHDAWLLPRNAGPDDRETVRTRAIAAARPPLVMPDPTWLCASEAVGWPMHPKDEARFAREEAMISGYWERLMAQFDDLPLTGVIAWGAQPYLSGYKLFRHGILADYGLRRGAWGLYARSGDRRYYDYAARFNRHIADWWVTHWTAGDKFRGGFASPGGYWEGHLPFAWGDRSTLTGDSSGHDIHNWLLEYYLTGNEHALHLHRMVGEATREKWDAERVRNAPVGRGGLERWEIPMPLRVLASLYVREWDEAFGTMARDLARRLIDLDNPNGLTDRMSGGALYKWERNVQALYDYYRATGDEAARAAILKALDYNYRFDLVGAPFGSTNHAALLYTAAYRWTGRPVYLRLVNDLVARSVASTNHSGAVYACAHPTMGVPAALGLLAEAAGPIERFPVLESRRPGGEQVVNFRKQADRPVEMSVYLTMSDAVAGDAATTALVTPRGPSGAGLRPLDGVEVRVEPLFRTSGLRGDPRKCHVRLTVPAEAPAGPYTLVFPGTDFVRILESDAPETTLP